MRTVSASCCSLLILLLFCEQSVAQGTHYDWNISYEELNDTINEDSSVEVSYVVTSGKR